MSISRTALTPRQQPAQPNGQESDQHRATAGTQQKITAAHARSHTGRSRHGWVGPDCTQPLQQGAQDCPPAGEQDDEPEQRPRLAGSELAQAEHGDHDEQGQSQSGARPRLPARGRPCGRGTTPEPGGQCDADRGAGREPQGNAEQLLHSLGYDVDGTEAQTDDDPDHGVDAQGDDAARERPGQPIEEHERNEWQGERLLCRDTKARPRRAR